VSPVRHSFSRAITAMHSWSYIGLIGSLKTSVFPVTNEGVVRQWPILFGASRINGSRRNYYIVQTAEISLNVIAVCIVSVRGLEDCQLSSLPAFDCPS
jgi:hypothetical protein